MTIEEVLREMRLYAEDDHYGPDVGGWLIAIEAAMQEPVAIGTGRKLNWLNSCMPSEDDTEMRELYALPPDAAGEIERLREQRFGPLVPPTAGAIAVFETVVMNSPTADMRAIPNQWLLNERALTSKVAEELEREIKYLRSSRDFYKRRCNELQKAQRHMRDPERKAVCDILANGKTAALAGKEAPKT